MLNSTKYKVTVKQVQQLCRLLNFIGRAIVPGCAFTRRLYAITGRNSSSQIKKLMPHHHVRLTKEHRLNLELWEHFLHHPAAFCRPFMDFTKEWKAEEIGFYTDASRNAFLGCGGICRKSWFCKQWDSEFVLQSEPSIAYLEVYALTAGILLYGQRFANLRIIVHCDNQAIVEMVNNNSSSCINCMVLIRILVLYSMIQNIRIHAVCVNTKDNGISDSLSRLQMDRFKRTHKRFGNK